MKVRRTPKHVTIYYQPLIEDVPYVVTKVSGATMPKPGDMLTEAAIQELSDAGFHVTIQ
jgi:hypothetical protein